MPRIVIDIDENMYQKIKGMETLILKNRAYKSLELAVLEGTVLPEHHGDLIDRKEVEMYVAEYGYKHKCNWIDNSIFYAWLKKQKSVIPAAERSKKNDCSLPI